MCLCLCLCLWVGVTEPVAAPLFLLQAAFYNSKCQSCYPLHSPFLHLTPPPRPLPPPPTPARASPNRVQGELSKTQKLRVQLVNVGMFLADSMPNVAERRDEISLAFLGCIPKTYSRERCDELHSALIAQVTPPPPPAARRPPAALVVSYYPVHIPFATLKMPFTPPRPQEPLHWPRHTKSPPSPPSRGSLGVLSRASADDCTDGRSY